MVIGSQTIAVPIPGRMLNRAIKNPHKIAPWIFNIERMTKPKKPCTKATIKVPLIVTFVT